MKNRITILLACVLLVTLFSIVNASAVATGPSDTDWIVTGDEVVENKTITLDGNLIVRGGGRLTLRNVTLTINNSYVGEYGISAEPGSSIAIYNSTLSPSNLDYGFAISARNASFVMKESELRGVGYRDLPALHLIDLQNAVVDGNVMTHIKSLALQLTNARDCVITNNTITTPYPLAFRGFRLDNSQNNKITDNHITGVFHGMVFGNRSTGNLVVNNEISPQTGGHLGFGVLLDGDSNNNAFVNNTIHGPTGCTAFRIFSLNNLIQGNTVHDMRFGVVIACASGNIVTNNNFSGIYEQEAVLVYRSSDNYIINNIISSSVRGVTLSNFSRNNTVQANSISTSERGISLFFSSDNNLIGNNKVFDNKVGITLWNSSNNKVYSNSLIGNAQQGYDDSRNSWTFKERGNYWSNYEGRDENGDGIGDTPYYVPPKGIDERPSWQSEPVAPVPVPHQKPLTFREVHEPPVREITKEVKLADREVLLENSYEIRDGGKLILENITLRSSQKVARPYQIIVHSGGSLLINNSKIIASETGESPISILALGNSTFVLRNSELHHVDGGMRIPGPIGAAIQIQSNGAVIENNTITDSQVGITLVRAPGSALIVNNTFSNVLAIVDQIGPGTILEGNVFHALPLAPTVETREATDIAAEAAILNLDFTLPPPETSWVWWPGQLGKWPIEEIFAKNTITGAYDSVRVYFEYRKAGEADWVSTAPVRHNASGSHSNTISGLQPNTHYEFRAQLRYDSSIVSGQQRTFKTLELQRAVTPAPKELPPPAPVPTPTPTPAPAPIPTPTPAPLVSEGINLWLAVAIVAGIVITGLVTYFFIRRRRRRVA